MPSDHKFRLLFFHCVINTCITCCHIQVRITADVAWPANPPVLCVSRWAYSGWNHCWYSMWYTLPPAAASRWESPLMLCDQPICLSLVYPGEHIQEKTTVDVAWPAEVSTFRWKSRLILSAISTCPLLAISRWEHSGGNHRWCHAWWTVPPAATVSRWDCSGASGCNHCWWLVISSSIWRCIQVRMSSQGLLISCSPPVNRFRPDSSCKQNKHDGTFPELGSWEKEHANCNYKVTQAKGGRATFQP